MKTPCVAGPSAANKGFIKDFLKHATYGEEALRPGDELLLDSCGVEVKHGRIVSNLAVVDDSPEAQKKSHSWYDSAPVCFIRVTAQFEKSQSYESAPGYVLVRGVKTAEKSIEDSTQPSWVPVRAVVDISANDTEEYVTMKFDIHVILEEELDECKDSLKGKVVLKMDAEECMKHVSLCPSLASIWDKYQAKLGNFEGVVVCDDRTDERLVESLNAGIDKLISSSCEPDYHPNTQKVVLDVIHPSLYPYVRGVSTVTGPEAEYESANLPLTAGRSEDKTINIQSGMKYERKDRWGRRYEDSKFQWLPSVLNISSSGGCSIKSYINNMPMEANSRLGVALEQLFERFLPMFEKCYGYLQTIKFHQYDTDDSDKDIMDITRVYEPSTSKSSLRGRDLKVVTKIVEYQLGNEDVFDGVWHVEGMSHESIVMTGLYILGRDEDFLGGDLLFKVRVTAFWVQWHAALYDALFFSVTSEMMYLVGGFDARADIFQSIVPMCFMLTCKRADFIRASLFKRAFLDFEASSLFMGVPQDRHPHTNKLIEEGLKPLGTLSTPEGRMVVFPNSHVHKLSKMYVNKEAGRDGSNKKRRTVSKRRIVVFWLVDPERDDIITTRGVSQPQQLSMSKDDAMRYRLELMEERKRFKQDWNVRTIELCEH